MTVDLSVSVQPRRVAAWLFIAIAVLSVLNALTLIAEYGFGRDHVKGLVPLFRLNAEGNIPTFFSAAQFLVASALCLLIGRATRALRRPDAFAWRALSVIALLLAFDEAAQIHDLLDGDWHWEEGLFESTGALTAAWVVPYAIFAVAFLFVFIRFFLRLPNGYKLLFGSAGAIYVASAIGLEVVGSVEWSIARDSLKFEMINSTEEMLEMSSLAIAMYGMLRYLGTEFGMAPQNALPNRDGPSAG